MVASAGLEHREALLAQAISQAMGAERAGGDGEGHQRSAGSEQAVPARHGRTVARAAAAVKARDDLSRRARSSTMRHGRARRRR
jgi:hypothetical protein